MDAHTLQLLEFEKIRELLAGYAATTLGKELARAIEPSSESGRIRLELALVSEMVDALQQGHAPPFGGVHDVRILVRRAAIGSMLTALQLLEVADTLSATGNVYRYRMRLPPTCQELMHLLGPIEDLGTIAKSITGCIDSRGHVLDLASPELAAVRGELAAIDEKVQNHIKRLLRDPELRKVLRYPNATVSGDHYVLPVAVNYRHRVPGLVHRTSSTGETLFIEPASVASLSAERAVKKAAEEREINRVQRRLSGEVGRHSRQLGHAIDIMARLDLVSAKAHFSRDYNMSMPELNENGRLWLRQARHPLLAHLFRTEPLATDTLERRRVVPIDVRLGQEFDLLIITGPNTGGKTVTLKTVGLIGLMAQSGMHIPAAAGSEMPVFERYLADIGDEQSLEQSLSTFSSHMSRIAAILAEAGISSLVMLDELGAGTDPTEGAALGRAILDHLKRAGCRALVTTHLGDLKTYAFANARAENAAVEFDVETLRPTYRLHIGQFGMSNALKIARRLKLPRGLIQRARHYLRRRQKRAPELSRLQELRQQTELARQEALRTRHEAEMEKQAYLERQAELERQAQEAQGLRDARARLQPNDSVHVPRFDKQGRVVRIDHKKNMVLVSVGLGQWEVPLDEVFPVASA